MLASFRKVNLQNNFGPLLIQGRQLSDMTLNSTTKFYSITS